MSTKARSRISITMRAAQLPLRFRAHLTALLPLPPLKLRHSILAALPVPAPELPRDSARHYSICSTRAIRRRTLLVQGTASTLAGCSSTRRIPTPSTRTLRASTTTFPPSKNFSFASTSTINTRSRRVLRRCSSRVTRFQILKLSRIVPGQSVTPGRSVPIPSTNSYTEKRAIRSRTWRRSAVRLIPEAIPAFTSSTSSSQQESQVPTLDKEEARRSYRFLPSVTTTRSNAESIRSNSAAFSSPSRLAAL